MKTWYILRQLKNGDTVSATMQATDIGIVLSMAVQIHNVPLDEIKAIGQVS